MVTGGKGTVQGRGIEEIEIEIGAETGSEAETAEIVIETEGEESGAAKKTMRMSSGIVRYVYHSIVAGALT